MISRIFLCLIFIFIIIPTGCSDEDPKIIEIEQDDEDDDLFYKHLALEVRCIDSYDNIRGAIVDVAVYDQLTHARLEICSTPPSGYFCTYHSIDSRQSYRVEIYTIDSKCIMAMWDISYANNPDWWIDDYGDPPGAFCNVGSCSNPSTGSGCWGN